MLVGLIVSGVIMFVCSFIFVVVFNVFEVKIVMVNVDKVKVDIDVFKV